MPLAVAEGRNSQIYYTCFDLSDVFHNIPLQLNQADKGKID